MSGSDRPRRLWASIVLLGIVTLILGAAAVILAVVSVTAGILIGSLLLFTATLLGGLAFVAATGVAGMWLGSPRGFWTSIVAHVVVLLALAGFMMDAGGAAAGLNKHLPAIVGSLLVLGSGSLLVTPASRDWHGV